MAPVSLIMLNLYPTIAMKLNRLFARVARSFLLRSFGRERLERILTFFARGVRINLLTLGYRSDGTTFQSRAQKLLIERMQDGNLV